MQPSRIRAFGHQAVLVEWEPEISVSIHQQVLQFEKEVLEQFKDEILESVPAYQSITIFLKPPVETLSFVTRLQQMEIGIDERQNSKPTLWKVPVCYDAAFGIDLQDVAKSTQLSIEQVITMHSKPHYRVFFTGFLPGFVYLGGLPETLHVPRRETPRLKINRGAVGIGGGQTGIYPQASPGGWQIIGQTPISLFDAQQHPPTLFQAGDALQFESISRDTYNRIESEVQAGTYSMEKLEQA